MASNNFGHAVGCILMDDNDGQVEKTALPNRIVKDRIVIHFKDVQEPKVQ